MRVGDASNGDMVTLRGTALDAHLGAVLLLDDESSVYIDGLARWPSEDYGKRMEVTGTLRSKKLAPDPTPSSGGMPRHGAMGIQTVVEGATWRVIP